MTLLYFFHDLNHSDVQRRVEMLRQGGAAVTVIGFHRMATVPVVEGATLVGLGITEDGNFPQRILAVLRTLLTLHRWRDTFADSDAVVARNLEMLVLAAMARWRFLPGRPLTYECVDIHRLPGRRGGLCRSAGHRLCRPL